jgi:uncharacterized protein (DUF1330 family)
MASYLVATVHITDPERFGKYVAGIVGLSERFGGETVARGKVSEMLEGEAPDGLRVIVSRYPDTASAKGYLDSPEYQAAKVDRIGAAEVTMMLLED